MRGTFGPRQAVILFFLIHGGLSGNWVVRIPDVRDNFALSEGVLGLVLLGLPIGVLTGLPFASGLISRFGSRVVTFWSAIAFCIVVPVLGFAPSTIGLFVLLVVFGWVASTNDVAINAQAVEVERLRQRSLMSSFHAAFSIGGVVGAVMGELFTGLGFNVQQHLIAAGVIFMAVALVAVTQLVDVENEKQGSGAVFTLPARVLLPLGAVAFVSAIGEGAMSDWSGVYMGDIVNVDDALDGLGFAAFSLTMTVGRISGDYFIDRFSTQTLVTASGVLSSAGLGVIVAFPTLVPALIGFALVGLGLSYAIPLMFAIAGRMPNLPPGAGIAGTATLGYTGFVAGPPIIGLVAEISSLRVSFTLLAVLAGSMVILSRSVRSYSGRVVRERV